jgi:Glycosyl hydrolase catalytic core
MKLKIKFIFRPDIASQSNLDPETAAQIWMAHGQPLRAQGYQTITPAMAFSKPWMQSFLKACVNCVVRFVFILLMSFGIGFQQVLFFFFLGLV